MKIAVTYENGNVFPCFGHAQRFKLYTAGNGKVVSSQVVGTDGSGHGALARLLSGMGTDVPICGGIGVGVQSAPADAGIKIYGVCPAAPTTR